MAIYSTFFLCETDRLHAGFPEWKLPLPRPVTRKSLNPFTRQEMTITTRAPEWEGFDESEMELPEYQIMEGEGDYQDYLEQRIPPFVQSLPHWCSKNLTSLELEPLIAAAIATNEAQLEKPLYAHPSLGTELDEFPDKSVMCLKVANESQLRLIAEKWAAKMSAPEHTHSVSGERVSDDWTIDDALSLLTPIAELARKCKATERIYLLTEG